MLITEKIYFATQANVAQFNTLCECANVFAKSITGNSNGQVVTPPTFCEPDAEVSDLCGIMLQYDILRLAPMDEDVFSHIAELKIFGASKIEFNSIF